MPREPAAATEPVASESLYPYRFISGSATRPIAAAVALVEPQIAAKPAQAAIVAITRPPRNCPNILWVEE